MHPGTNQEYRAKISLYSIINSSNITTLVVTIITAISSHVINITDLQKKILIMINLIWQQMMLEW